MSDIAVIINTKDGYIVKYGKDEKYLTSNSLDLAVEILESKDISYVVE